MFYDRKKTKRGTIFGLGHTELLIILVVGLIIFGAKRLPEIGSGMGSAIRNFKKGISSVDKKINQEPEKIQAGE